MTLSALNLLAAIVSPLSSHAGGLYRLAIHYACTGLGISAHANAHPLTQGRVHPLPGAVDPPSSEVMMDGLPGRKLMGKQAPGTPTTDDVEDGVKDLAQGVYS